jgi:hypothetical protein
VALEVEMARSEDYQKALDLAKGELTRADPKEVSESSGARFQADSQGNLSMVLRFLGKEVRVSWPALDITVEGTREGIPIQQQIILLHYLKGVLGVEPAQKWIAYQEIPDGKFYLDAFLRRAKNPMVQGFGENPERLVQLATEVYDARPSNQGDQSVVVSALPRVPVALLLWRGDDEFSPEGNILFDESIQHIFSAEDVAWLAGMIIYPLIGMAKQS